MLRVLSPEQDVLDEGSQEHGKVVKTSMWFLGEGEADAVQCVNSHNSFYLGSQLLSFMLEKKSPRTLTPEIQDQQSWTRPPRKVPSSPLPNIAGRCHFDSFSDFILALPAE